MNKEHIAFVDDMTVNEVVTYLIENGIEDRTVIVFENESSLHKVCIRDGEPVVTQLNSFKGIGKDNRSITILDEERNPISYQLKLTMEDGELSLNAKTN